MVKKFSFENFVIGYHLVCGTLGSFQFVQQTYEEVVEDNVPIPNRILIFPAAVLVGFGAGVVSPWLKTLNMLTRFFEEK